MRGRYSLGRQLDVACGCGGPGTDPVAHGESWKFVEQETQEKVLGFHVCAEGIFGDGKDMALRPWLLSSKQQRELPSW